MSFTTDLSNKTTIFWDFENIPMNGILQATEFINWVKITCNGSINVICDTNRVQEDVRTYLRYLNVHLKDPHSKKNNSADITIINEVYRVVWTNKPPYRFCFITKDGDFAETISQLKEWGYEVWLLTNKNGHSNFLTEITSKTIFIPYNLYDK